MLADMELSEAFDASIRVPSIATLAGVTHVLREVDFFRSQADERRLHEQLEQAGLGQKGLNVGVKKLLGLVEMARQDREPVDTFVKNLMEYLG
jgi:vesicle-fusing ATPase